MKAQDSINEELVSQLFAFINSRIHNEEDAADILQDAFLKAIDSIDQLANQDKFIPWIYQIARNAIPEFYRKHKKELPIDEESI